MSRELRIARWIVPHDGDAVALHDRLRERAISFGFPSETGHERLPAPTTHWQAREVESFIRMLQGNMLSGGFRGKAPSVASPAPQLPRATHPPTERDIRS
jgi:hypothetical protein